MPIISVLIRTPVKYYVSKYPGLIILHHKYQQPIDSSYCHQLCPTCFQNQFSGKPRHASYFDLFASVENIRLQFECGIITTMSGSQFMIFPNTRNSWCQARGRSWHWWWWCSGHGGGNEWWSEHQHQDWPSYKCCSCIVTRWSVITFIALSLHITHGHDVLTWPLDTTGTCHASNMPTCTY